MGGFERHEGNEELKALDLGPLAQELEAYNEQFSVGATIGRALAGMIPKKKTEERTGLDEVDETEDQLSFQKLDEVDETEDQLSFQKRVEDRFGITLQKIGLELQPVKGAGAIYHETGTIESSALRLNLADAAQFAMYLSALEPESISASQIQGLTRTAEVLREQLLQEYEGDQKDPRTAALMDGLESIVENYQRLDPQGDRGLAVSVKELPTIGKAHKGDYLPQYLEIQRQGLFSKIGERKFGPSDWHIDMTDKSYRERWTKAIKVLEELKKNPRAMELHSDLLSNLLACAEHAYRDLQEEAKESPSKETEKMKVLEEVLANLNEGVN